MPHIHYRYDFVISVFIVHQQSVLMVHHPRYSKWLPIGGHIELDEDPEQALYREIQEECNVDVKILSDKPTFKSDNVKSILPARYIEVHDANLPHQHIALIYFAQAMNTSYRLSDEHTAMQWIDKNELSSPKYALSESVKFYCQEAIKTAVMS
jgi:ADP-ribose pyrophosphatase YjhB (NUDIX family)